MKNENISNLIVVKRSGQRVAFDESKIAIVIKKAFDSVITIYDEVTINKIFEDVLLEISNNYRDRKTINVEDIQDIIENTLKNDDMMDVYISFSEYRKTRALSREVFKDKARHKFIKAIDKISLENFMELGDVSTPDETLINYGRVIASEYSKSYVIDSKYLKAHEEGRIHINDIDTFPLGMLSDTNISLTNYFDNHDSFDDFIVYVVNIHREVSGEINLARIDEVVSTWVLNKYKYFLFDYISKYLRLTGFDCFINLRKVREIIYRLNDMNIENTLLDGYSESTKVNEIIKRASVDASSKTCELLRGKLDKLFCVLSKYNKYSVSFGTHGGILGDVVNKCIRELVVDNLYIGLNFIYKVDSDNSFKDIKEMCTNGNNLYITFLNDNYEGVEYFIDGIRIYDNYNSDTKSSIGRMLVNSCTLNIGRIALECQTKREVNDFYKVLDTELELIKGELLLGFETVGNKVKENYKYLFTGNIDTDEKLLEGQKIRKVIKNGTVGIGLVGLNFASTIMSKKDTYKFILEVIEYIKSKCCEFTHDSKINFIVYDQENKSIRRELIKIDKTIYGVRDNLENSEYYTSIMESIDISKDYKKVSKLQNSLDGGVFKIKVNDRLEETLKELSKDKVLFIKLEGDGVT